MVPKAGYAKDSGENRPLVAKNPEQNRLSEQSSELVSVFKVASRKFLNIFLFHKCSLKIKKTFCAYTRRTHIILLAFNKNIRLRCDPVSLKGPSGQLYQPESGPKVLVSSSTAVVIKLLISISKFKGIQSSKLLDTKMPLIF